MTPLLQQLLKLPEITKLVKIEQRKEPEKTQEVFYVTEKMSPTEEVWEKEVEEHTEVLYEDELTPVGKTLVLLSEVDVLSTTEKQTQKDKKSELKGEISVTDTSKRKETRVTRHRVIPKKEEIIVVVQETQFDKDKKIATVQDKPKKEKTKEELFVRTFKSPTEEITDERKDSTSVSILPDKQDISKLQTRVTVKKESEITIKTESRERKKREEPGETIAIKEIELVKDVPFVKKADKTKPSPVNFSTEARKHTDKLEIEVMTFTEVPYKEVGHGVEIKSAIPEEKYSRTKEITVEPREVTVKDKPTKVISTQLKMVEEEISAPPVISDSKKGPEQVSIKKHEPAEREKEKKPKADEIIDMKKEKVPEKSKVEVTPGVKPKESVTDIKLKKPKVMEQEAELKSITAKTETGYKKKGSRDVPPQKIDTEKAKEESLLIKDTVQTKPEEKKRISPQTPSRGTERKSNIMIISISNFFIRLQVWLQSLFFFIQSHGQPPGVIISVSVYNHLFHLISSHFHIHCVSLDLQSLFYYIACVCF